MGSKQSPRGNANSDENQSEVIGFAMSELMKLHQAQLQLCERLEQMADRLPNDINPQECLSLSRLIFPVLKRAHEFEEENLFPALLNNGTNREQMEQSLERLKFEHWEDESFAEEISTSLIAYVRQPERQDAEPLSYMLRGFIEGVRRHIAFEVEHLLPQLKPF